MKQSMASIVVLLSLTLTGAAQAQQYPDHPHMWGGWGGMIFGPLMMIVFLGAIVVVIVLLVRWLKSEPTGTAVPPPAGKTALDILKERFARGEIDKEEFEERKRLLSD